jgi:hypothetical protein
MRIVGWVAAILGVIGLVICLVIAVGVWFVKPEVVRRVDHVATVAVDTLEKASDLSTDASALLTEVKERLDAVASTASSVSGNPILTAAADRLLSGTISNLVVGPWTSLQDRLSGIRETAVGLSTSVQALDEAIPFIELPGVVTSVVDDVDARWTELDQTVQGIESAAADGVGTSDKAAQIAQTATEASQKLQALSVALGEVHGKVESAQAQISDASDQIEGVVGLGALGICLVALWVGLLHLLLIAQGRRWARAES